MNTNRLSRYQEELLAMPPSGGGGCHTALLRIANYGRLAGVDPDRLASDLASHVHGGRVVTAAEINAAVDKAFNSRPRTASDGNFRIQPPRPIIDGAKLLAGIEARGAHFGEAELLEASPVQIDWPPERDAVEVLRLLYAPEERIFIGTRYDGRAGSVLSVATWQARFQQGDPVPEHIIPNPLTGEASITKDGKQSFRADSCVARFRFAVVEFDSMPREQQIRFWAGVKLPVVALLDSGGKSIHGWVRIDAASASQWEQRVEGKLFDLLTAVGADGACKNESRLSRMPGHFRTEKDRWQRILYLNPKGGPVIP